MLLELTMKYLKEKMILALFPAGLFVLTDMHKEIIAIILWMLIIDTVLGVMVSIKNKNLRSHKLRDALYKFMLYMMAMFTAFLVSQLDIPYLEYFYLYVGSFIAITEALSNFENLAILGFKLPKQLLAKLNDDFKSVVPDKK